MHMNNPYTIVDEFERTIANIAGSKYAIAVDSCSNAIFLCWRKKLFYYYSIFFFEEQKLFK